MSTDTADTSMVDKIRFLLRKTTESGCSKEESQAAMEMAQKLMTKYGIEKVRVEDAEASDMRKKIEITQRDHATGRQRYETDQYIAQILRQCFHVRILWSYSIELITAKHKDGTIKRYAYSQEEKRVMKKRLVYLLVGDKEDIDMAEMIITELHPIMRHLLNRYLRETGQTWSAIVCHSFFEGLTSAYISANKKGREEAMLEAGAQASSRYALVCVDKGKEAENYISHNIRTVRARTMSGGRSWERDPEAREKGKKAGENLKLGMKKLE